MTMRCPRCGSSRLAWSGDSGYLVCQECGAIIETLFDEYMPSSELEARRRRLPTGEPVGGPPARTPLESELDRVSRTAVRRGKVVAVRGGQLVMVSIATRSVAEGETKKLLELMDKYPTLKSRTQRVKVGLALYARMLAAGMSKSRALEEASRLSGASERSIESAAKRYKECFESYSLDVKEALGLLQKT